MKDIAMDFEKNIDGGALADLRVLDIATAAAAPWASTLMADFGAEVIKVEKPNEGDPIRSWGEQKGNVPLFWQSIGRGKKSITLDLRKEKGKEIFLSLCKTADVVVENFRSGTLERWGIGPDILHEVNPKLVILRLTGFGQFGPYSKRPGFGTLAEAMSGYSYTTGLKDGPPTLPSLPLGDGIAGIFGAFSIMVALHARNSKRIGKGQVLDLALYEPILRLLEANTIDYDQLGVIRTRQGNRLPQTTPRNLYKTLDSAWIALSGSTPATAERVLRAIGRADLISNPKFSNNRARRENADELDELIQAWFEKHSLQEALVIMEEYEVAVAPVYSVKDVFEDPHFQERETIIKVPSEELGEVALNNVIPKMSLTPGSIRWPGPTLGKHNKEIYCNELGMCVKDLEILQQENVI
ncbi:CaiB/BaiF CoA transferase family protein [Fredinandcohnia onubensis]|uniref:CaiB/BaiF CoA transferase family protein n=1 Tax=Fredinandcohnia onubensis TaxID=1571209 RepID=UPI001C5576F1|nr:CoA transferase [Fredinandcohnia onubensis]